MKLPVILSGLSLAVVLASFGCGGGGSSSGGGGSVAKAGSVFQGGYVGPFAYSGSNTDKGEFAIEVSATGAITGRYIDVTSPSSGVVISGQITPASSTASTDTGSVTVTASGGTATGNLTLMAGTLSGSVTDKTNGLTINFTSGLVSTQNTNSFAGFYNGIFTVNGVPGTPADTCAMIIDGSGAITAFITDNVTNDLVTVAISVGTITSKTGTTTLGASMGTLTLANGVLSGPLTRTSTGQPSTTFLYTLNANT